MHIFGTTGRISIEIPFNIPPDRPTHIFLAAGGDPPVAPLIETITVPAADPYTVEADAFATAILEDRPVPVDPADGVANLRVIERLFASAEQGGSQACPDARSQLPVVGADDPAGARLQVLRSWTPRRRPAMPLPTMRVR